MIKRFVIVGIIFGVLIGGISFLHFVFLPKVIEDAIRGGPVPTETISAEAAKFEDWTPFVRAIGTVKATTGIDLAPKVGGVVRDIEFASGDKVKAGQIMFQLDDAQEQADLQAQAATLKNADAELERRKDLVAKGFSPKAEFDASLARRDAAAAAMERTQAAIAEKVIRAPWDGEAGIRKVDPGAFVAPGTPLVRLQAIDPVYVDFNVPENDFARVAAGQSVEATFGAWPGQIFKGVVEAVDAQVVENTRAFTVRAKLANPDAHMVPGMFANVAVVAGEPARVVTLPQTAVTYSLYGDSVYVVVPQPDAQAGTTDTGEPKLQVERRFVRLGEARSGRVSLAEGVKEGEQVVTAGQLKLRPGTFVRIDNSVVLEQTGERKAE
jgi:membrane fusion protein, multidrug efflux system